ncbi:MAG: DUF1036 domain-containing protein, partial [Pseudomonadota bacterium]
MRTITRKSLAIVQTVAAALSLFAIEAIGLPDPASADFRLCNKTLSRISVAIGYKSDNGWRSEGWWNFNPRNDPDPCKILIPGPLRARFFYVYAIDVTHGGEWGGPAILCTRQKEFTIDGIKDCILRGYEQTGFFEVDTRNQESWTIELTDPEREGS